MCKYLNESSILLMGLTQYLYITKDEIDDKWDEDGNSDDEESGGNMIMRWRKNFELSTWLGKYMEGESCILLITQEIVDEMEKDVLAGNLEWGYGCVEYPEKADCGWPDCSRVKEPSYVLAMEAVYMMKMWMAMKFKVVYMEGR